MSNLHLLLDEANKHAPKGFDNVGAKNFRPWKDELSESTYTENFQLPRAINFVDGTVAAPTSVNGDIYVLTGAGVIDPSWGLSTFGDWTRATNTIFTPITPIKGALCYDDTASQWKEFDGAAWISHDANATNLGIANITATNLDVTSDTGTDATVPAATASDAGLMTAAKFNEVVVNNGKVTFPEAPNDGTQYARKSLGWEAVAGGGGTDFANTYWVDPNGNDGTGILGDNTKPFLTLEAARDQAVIDGAVGKLVIVNAGAYNVTTTDAEGIGISGLNWHFEMGAVITKTTAGRTHSWEGFADSTNITGYGVFLNGGVASSGGFSMYNSNDIFEFDEIQSTSGYHGIYLQASVAGYQPIIRGRRLMASIGSPIRLVTRGTANILISEIVSTSTALAVRVTRTAATRGLVVVADRINGIGGSAIQADYGNFVVGQCLAASDAVTATGSGDLTLTGYFSRISVVVSNSVTLNGNAYYAVVNGAGAKLIGGIVNELILTDGEVTDVYMGTSPTAPSTVAINGGKAFLKRRDSTSHVNIIQTDGELTLDDNISSPINTVGDLITQSGGILYLNGYNKIGIGTGNVFNFLTMSGTAKLVLRGTIDMSDSVLEGKTCISYGGGTIVSEGGTILMGAETDDDQNVGIVATVASLELKVKNGLFLDRVNPILPAQKVKWKVDVTTASVACSITCDDTSGADIIAAVAASKAVMAKDIHDQINGLGSLDMTATQDTLGVDEYLYIEMNVGGVFGSVSALTNLTEVKSRKASYAMTNTIGGTIIQDTDVE